MLVHKNTSNVLIYSGVFNSYFLLYRVRNQKWERILKRYIPMKNTTSWIHCNALSRYFQNPTFSSELSLGMMYQRGHNCSYPKNLCAQFAIKGCISLDSFLLTVLKSIRCYFNSIFYLFLYFSSFINVLGRAKFGKVFFQVCY